MGKLLDRALGRTKYGSMPSTSAKLLGKQLVVFVPHDSEFPAIAPLIERICKSKGSVTVIQFDAMERTKGLRKRLGDYGSDKSERKLCQFLFDLQDRLLRLELLHDLLTDPDVGILEMHTLPKDYTNTDQFPWYDYYQRIGNSRIIAPKRLYEDEYDVPIRRGLKRLSITPANLNQIFLGQIRLDLVSEYLDVLRQGISRKAMLLVEIPALSSTIDPPSGMSFHTTFEKNRAGDISTGITLSDFDISTLLSILLM